MNVARHLILIVEDDAATRTFLADNMKADGYAVITTDCADSALVIAAKQSPDLALVDVNGGSGHDFARLVRDGIRGLDHRLPMILLSSEFDERNRVRAFEAGADDVVAKPFSYPELIARVRALFRRVELGGPAAAPPMRSVAGLVIDSRTRTVTVDGEPIEPLTSKEFALLWQLAGDPERVFTKGELLRSLWGHSSVGTTRTLDSHACRLRGRLTRAGAGRIIVNVWGVGYRLTDPVRNTVPA